MTPTSRLGQLALAILAMTSDPSPEAIMTSAIEGATELASARYGSFRVLEAVGAAERNIHAGAPPDRSARIGRAPGEYSRAGAIDTTARANRLQRADAPSLVHRSEGRRPQPGSHLDVPIRVGGSLFGVLSLTDSVNGRFSAQDEELVAAIAVATGAALTNSSLAERLLVHERWLAAATLIRAQLATAAGEDPLVTIVGCLAELTDADIVAVALTCDAGTQLEVLVAAGPDAHLVREQRFELAHSVARRAMDSGVPILLPLWCGADTLSRPVSEILPGSLMVIPLHRRGQACGVLSLLRCEAKPPFTAPDLFFATDVAQQAGVALELADARDTEADSVLMRARESISKHLHDDVIQQLFGIGLSLEATAGDMGPGDSSTRIHQRVVEIDIVIDRIRDGIFPEVPATTTSRVMG